MENELHYYELIRNILSQHRNAAAERELVKQEIIDALAGDDYITAVTAYLWGAYNNFDSAAKTAFKTIFHDDLKQHNPSAFYFFSFYFLNDFKRAGFDRRTDSDRRKCYSLDFFGEKIIERRQGGDRRKDPEKRLNWTRVTKWVSVPFNYDAVNGAGRPGTGGFSEAASDDINAIDRLHPTAGIEIRSLNLILSSLILYYESHIREGQTAWLNNVDEEIFERAKSIMRDLLER
jgi:hypothetical protein